MKDDNECCGGCKTRERKPTMRERVRGLTSLSLDWLAERFRKTQAVRERVQNGTYKVGSNELAEAMVDPKKRKH